MEFNKHQQALIEDLFEELNGRDIQYVIPRGYEKLPEAVPGGDIDVLVHANDYSESISIAKSSGFESNTTLVEFIGLLNEGIKMPQTVFKHLVTEPSIIYDEVREVLFDSETGEVTTSYSEYKGYENDVMIHFMNHLAYTSPLNGQKIRVNPSVEDAMHERSKRYDLFSQPSKPDELAHLVCRGVFDKEGNFPKYYIDRCDQLWRDICDDRQARSDLEELLSALFFDADDLVITTFQESSYDDLKGELIQFSEY